MIASVDTYLRFADAVNRLDIAADDNSRGFPELREGLYESGAKGVAKGAIETAQEALGLGDREQRGRRRSPS